MNTDLILKKSWIDLMQYRVILPREKLSTLEVSRACHCTCGCTVKSARAYHLCAPGDSTYCAFFQISLYRCIKDTRPKIYLKPN